MTDKVRALLAACAREPERVRRHLLMAAAIEELLDASPVVVGGTAEEFWTRDEYHPTDLDLCAPIGRAERAALEAAGFEREGRHWSHPGVPTVAVEFPDDRIDGDEQRVRVEIVEGVRVRIIGVDDLYLDRLRQATANASEGSREFMSTLAVAAARYEDLDRDYIEARLDAIAEREPMTAEDMRRIDRLVQRRARDALS